MSQSIEFFFILFWICFFVFFFSYSNFFRLLLIAELIWGIFYVLSIFLGLENGLIFEISFSFFILVFASFEFVIGIMLIRFLKSLKFYSSHNPQNLSTSKWKKIFVNNFKF